jgi:cytochrome c556
MKLKQMTLAAVALALTSGAFAQVKPEDEIRYRQSVMNVNGRAFGPMAAMAQDKAPYNKDVVVKNTAIVEMMIGLPWNSFAAGTEKGAPTKADMKVWSEAAKFKEGAEKAQKAVAALASTVKGGDEKAIKAAIGDVGKTCKGCHDDFRLKEFRN